MRKFIDVLGFCFIVFVVLNACTTSGDLTEEEILALDQQDYQYSFQILDPYTNAGVEGATLEATVNGEVITVVTNSQGSAEFQSPFQGTFEIVLSKSDYFETRQTVDFTNDNRTKILARTFYIFPTSDYGTFEVKGKFTIQSDITTPEREAAPNARFEVQLRQNGVVYSVILVNADNSGNYSVILPSWFNLPFGGDIRFRYTPYQTDQRIAINRLTSQPSFPETLPSTPLIKTTFDPASGALSIPFVQAVYATIPAPPAGPDALQASPFFLGLNGSGGVSTGTSFLFSGGGDGYGAADISLNIISIVGGSGATGVVRDTNLDGTLDQYQISVGGSGYPQTANANRVGGQSFSATRFNNNTLYGQNSEFRPGAIIVNDVFLGTGTSRGININ